MKEIDKEALKANKVLSIKDVEADLKEIEKFNWRNNMKDKILTIIAYTIIILLVVAMVVALYVSINGFKELKEEVDNSEVQVYEVSTYQINDNGYYRVRLELDGEIEVFNVRTIEYSREYAQGMYLKLTPNQSLNYIQYYFSDGHTKYNATLIIGIGE
jgi:hypothetical protein